MIRNNGLELIINKIIFIIAKFKTIFFYKLLFKKIHHNSVIYKPLFISNAKYITIGKKVMIRSNLRIEAIDKFRIPVLEIGDNCNIEQNVQIICSNKVIIGENCSITANCAIVDTEHPYEDITVEKVGSELSSLPKEVVIGSYSFIGIGSIVLPNVILGTHCFVGANSVVTRSFPAYSVLAGNPARMIRRYDFENETWKKTNKEGQFIDEI